jgi:hypothetical protein
MCNHVVLFQIYLACDSLQPFSRLKYRRYSLDVSIYPYIRKSLINSLRNKSFSFSLLVNVNNFIKTIVQIWDFHVLMMGKGIHTFDNVLSWTYQRLDLPASWLLMMRKGWSKVYLSLKSFLRCRSESSRILKFIFLTCHERTVDSQMNISWIVYHYVLSTAYIKRVWECWIGRHISWA